MTTFGKIRQSVPIREEHLSEVQGWTLMFSIYEVLPEILELWGSNLVTDVASKKNSSAAAVK